MQEEEECVGEGDPEPGDLHEEGVEEVFFEGEVAGCGGRGVRLRDWVVRGGAGVGFEEGE